MPEIVWTESAVDDLNRHYDFLKINNADAAARAIQGVVSSAESLLENPRRGTAIGQSSGLLDILPIAKARGFLTTVNSWFSDTTY
jgi:plasmid stabilization system protein ParE